MKTFAPIVLIAALLGCASEPGPTVEESTRAKSPDGRWEAVVEKVDNGMGFGLGALFYEVHIVKAGEPITIHGDPSSSVVFYIESTDWAEAKVRAVWVDPRHLQIEFPHSPKPGKMVNQFGSIAIEFKVLQAPKSPSSPSAAAL